MNEEKILHEDCQGKFSTAPQLVGLHLPEIILYIPSPFPLRSIMTIDLVESEYSEPLPAFLTSNTVTLSPLESVELSVIATTHWKNGKAPPKADQIPFEIPTTMDFPLSIEYPSSSRDYETLISSTKQIYDHFDPTRVRLFHTSNATPQGMAKVILHQAVRTGHEKEGVVLKLPSFTNPMCCSNKEHSAYGLLPLASESNSGSTASDETGIYSYIEYPGISASESLKNRHHSRRFPIIEHQDRLSTHFTEEEQSIAFLQSLNKQQVREIFTLLL